MEELINKIVSLESKVNKLYDFFLDKNDIALTNRQAANILGCSETTIWRMIADGRLERKVIHGKLGISQNSLMR